MGVQTLGNPVDLVTRLSQTGDLAALRQVVDILYLTVNGPMAGPMQLDYARESVVRLRASDLVVHLPETYLDHFAELERALLGAQKRPDYASEKAA